MTPEAAHKRARITIGIAATVLLGAGWGTALASSDIEPTCLEPVAHTDDTLHELLEKDAPAFRVLEATEAETEVAEEVEEASSRNTEIPGVATRLSSESASVTPRYRREMFRTDI